MSIQEQETNQASVATLSNDVLLPYDLILRELLETFRDQVATEGTDRSKRSRRPKKIDMLAQTEFTRNPKAMDMYPWGVYTKGSNRPDRPCNRVLRLRACNPPRVTSKRPAIS